MMLPQYNDFLLSSRSNPRFSGKEIKLEEWIQYQTRTFISENTKGTIQIYNLFIMYRNHCVLNAIMYIT